MSSDPLVAFLKTEAANLLHRAKHNEENYASFLESATQTLLSFNQGGRLAGYGRTADRNIAALRQRPVIAFIEAPLSHGREFGPLTSIVNYNLLAACKDAPAGHKVHIVGEEALNFRFADLVGDLETMRGLGVTADFYVQSYAGLVRKYGRESAEAVDAYAGVKVYAALSSFERAKHVSDMLAESTIRKQDYSYRTVATDLGVASREMGRRLMSADEVLAMPRGEAWVFVQGLRPLRLTLAHYGQVDPWRDLVSDNPIEGAPLRDEPAFALRYPVPGESPPGDIALEAPPPPASSTTSSPPSVPLVRACNLVGLGIVAGIIAIAIGFGTPHLRFEYTYVGTEARPTYLHCTYVGLNSVATIRPGDGRCPLVTLLRAREAGDGR